MPILRSLYPKLPIRHLSSLETLLLWAGARGSGVFACLVNSEHSPVAMTSLHAVYSGGQHKSTSQGEGTAPASVMSVEELISAAQRDSERVLLTAELGFLFKGILQTKLHAYSMDDQGTSVLEQNQKAN